MKIYSDDIIYTQKDKSEEIFFILKGRIRLYVEMDDQKTRLGFNQYVQGSYFGDSDVFTKSDRDSTAIAILESNLLVLGKKDLKKMIKSNSKVEQEMINVALERKNYHYELICEYLLKDKEALGILRFSVENPQLKQNA